MVRLYDVARSYHVLWLLAIIYKENPRPRMYHEKRPLKTTPIACNWKFVLLPHTDVQISINLSLPEVIQDREPGYTLGPTLSPNIPSARNTSKTRALRQGCIFHRVEVYKDTRSGPQSACTRMSDNSAAFRYCGVFEDSVNPTNMSADMHAS
jgi:hypothetical protein